LPLISPYATVCGQCMKHPPPFARALCYGAYAGTLKEAVHLLKFQGIKRLARPLGGLLLALDLPGADCVAPVPLSPGALRRRGFNQSYLLARALAAGLGLPLAGDVLYKRKETPSQVGLTRAQRLGNLKGAFALRRKPDGERVLLVDDVMTTGATMGACARTLLRGGAKEVTAVSLARSP
jgi:ComF family protein